MGTLYGMGWGGGFGFGWIFMLLFWGLIIWGIIVLAKSVSSEGGCCGGNQQNPENRENNAVNILKERYAKGEISKEDFDRIKNDLG